MGAIRKEVLKNIFNKFSYDPFSIDDVEKHDRKIVKYTLAGKHHSTGIIKRFKKWDGVHYKTLYQISKNYDIESKKKKNWCFTPDYTSGGFASTWLTIIVLMFTIALAWAIFAPMIDKQFSDLVDFYAYDNAALLSSKSLVISFFDIFPYIFCFFILVWGVLSSLRREQDSFQR